jgi:hypothetical protein
MATALISARCHNYPNSKWLEAQLQKLNAAERARVAVFLDDTRTLGLMAQSWRQKMLDIARNRDPIKFRELARQTSLRSIRVSRDCMRILEHIYQTELALVNEDSILSQSNSSKELNQLIGPIDPVLNCINQQSQCLDLIYINVIHPGSPAPVVHIYEARKVLPEIAQGNSDLPKSLQDQILAKYSFEIDVLRQQLL